MRFEVNLAAELETVRPIIEEVVEHAVCKALDERDGDQLLGVPDAARMLDLSEAAVRKRAARGGIACVRLGRSLRFRKADLIAEIRSRRCEAIR